MSWNDRVVRTKDEAGVAYAIYEVYDNDAGEPEARTEHPSYPAGETIEELEEDLQHYLAALQQPMLDDAVCQRTRGQPFGADDNGSTHDQP
jgi:hypothetical protein